MRRLLMIGVFTLLSWHMAWAEVVTKTIGYQQGDTRLLGYLAYPKDTQVPRPGVLIVPEFWGLNDYVRNRARQLAELGYVALAADIYGQGKNTTDPKEAGALAKIYKDDRILMRARARAGLDTLKGQPMIDGKRLAAIGYCFGGTTVLELARSGAELDGVVSFHGGLDTPNPTDARNIRAKVLVLHGADDPFVPPEQVAAFQDGMRKAGVDWQFIAYSGAVHSFSNPAAGNDNTKGAAYNANADRRSWEAMRQFFTELFK